MSNNHPWEKASERLSVGAVVGNRYKITQPLGLGSMGCVYLAQDTMLDEDQVAIKILHRDCLDKVTMLKRFYQEVKLTRRVNHKNVVRTYDVGSHNDLIYFTMEYVQGCSLLKVIEQEPFSETMAYEIIKQIADGLDAIHKAEIVHRDLKPENILISKDGVVHITDFGVSRHHSSQVTSHREILGSVCYIAPEVWLGQTITAAVDLYALGIILYELATHRVPFDGATPAAVMKLHLDEPPVPPKHHNPSTPQWLNDLILSLLAKIPSGRPASAKDIIEFIDQRRNRSNVKLESHTTPAQPASIPSIPTPNVAPTNTSTNNVAAQNSLPQQGIPDNTTAILPKSPSPNIPDTASLNVAANHNVLIIDDDPDMYRLIEHHIVPFGYMVENASDGLIGVNQALTNKYSLIILDLTLPKLHGIEVCKRIRQENKYIPILMLTSRSEELDQVLGLEVGADDYMTKPFRIRELVARIKALLRRSELSQPAASQKNSATWRFKELEIDMESKKVSRHGEPVALTRKQFDVLALLASQPGCPFTADQLRERVWRYPLPDTEAYILSFIDNLRDSLELDPENPRYIKTVNEVGYRFAELGEL